MSITQIDIGMTGETTAKQFTVKTENEKESCGMCIRID